MLDMRVMLDINQSVFGDQLLMKPHRKRTVSESQKTKNRQKQQAKYQRTVVDPARRLATLLTELDKEKGTTRHLRTA